MSEIGKKKEINFGITDELKNFLNDWTTKTFESAEKLNEEKNEEKNVGIEVKVAIVEIVKRELEKIEKELNKCDDDDNWFKLIEKIDKISDIVRWWIN